MPSADPEIDVIIDGYSPDLARGVVNAVQSLGLESKIQLSDFGGSEYTVPLIKSGSRERSPRLRLWAFGFRGR